MSRLRGHSPRLLRRLCVWSYPAYPGRWGALAVLCERCFSRFGKKCGPKLQPVNPRPRVAATPPLGPVRRRSRMGTTPSTQPGFPAFRKRSQEQRPTLVAYQGPRKILCLSTGIEAASLRLNKHSTYGIIEAVPRPRKSVWAFQGKSFRFQEKHSRVCSLDSSHS
jgi:hypothetical protein